MNHSRRARVPFHAHLLLHGRETPILSTGDASLVDDLLEQDAAQPSTTVTDSHDSLYLIYLLLLALFYVSYLTVLVRLAPSLVLDEHDDDYFDNYEREIPRLLWFRKGHRWR